MACGGYSFLGVLGSWDSFTFFFLSYINHYADLSCLLLIFNQAAVCQCPQHRRSHPRVPMTKQNIYFMVLVTSLPCRSKFDITPWYWWRQKKRKGRIYVFRNASDICYNPDRCRQKGWKSLKNTTQEATNVYLIWEKRLQLYYSKYLHSSCYVNTIRRKLIFFTIHIVVRCKVNKLRFLH